MSSPKLHPCRIFCISDLTQRGCEPVIQELRLWHCPGKSACLQISLVDSLRFPKIWDSQKTRNTTRRKCCTRHVKWRWRSPKWYACHEKCNSSSSENAAKVLCKRTFLRDVKMSQNVTKYHACHVKRDDSLFWNLQKWIKMTSFAASPIDTGRKPENRDKTCWSLKTSISCKTSWFFHTL